MHRDGPNFVPENPAQPHGGPSNVLRRFLGLPELIDSTPARPAQPYADAETVGEAVHAVLGFRATGAAARTNAEIDAALRGSPELLARLAVTPTAVAPDMGDVRRTVAWSALARQGARWTCAKGQARGTPSGQSSMADPVCLDLIWLSCFLKKKLAPSHLVLIIWLSQHPPSPTD